MNSSGIKRGLAASAVSALAVAGIPALASSASAAPGDVITVGSVGPTLNGGNVGGVVVLKTKNISEAEAEGDPTAAATPALKLVNASLTGSPNNANQSVAIVGAPVFVAEGTAGDSNTTDGFDEVTVHVKATTTAAGDNATYAVYLDDSDNDAVEAGEARAQVTQQTSGPLAAIDVAPASQSTSQGIASGAYTVTLKDTAGRTTQLNTGEAVNLTPPGTVTTTETGNSITASEAELGTDTFTATGSAVGSFDIALDSTTTPAVHATANLKVTAAANIDADEVDFVTAADSWNGFGDGTDGGTTFVRVDQGSIRVDIKSDDPNSTVTLNVSSANVTFGGKGSTTVSTVLDSHGVGSLTITPDAGTVQVNDSITVGGSFGQTLTFQRSAPAGVTADANPYFSALKATTNVTVTVVDQFGNPVTSGFVSGYRSAGPNAETAPGQVKPVGADGKATFAFTDAKATVGQQDTVTFGYVPDQFSTTPTATGATVIKYTATGQGSDFKTRLDGVDTETATYAATDVSVIPLTDTDADSNDETADLAIGAGEPGSDVTVTVDNGALILANGEDLLSEGSSSITDTINGGGNLPTGYRIVGTKSGVVTVTVTSANRTETAKFTVSAQNDWNAARNVTVSGPAEVESGATQITYTAVVTDAFGNPVVGVPATWLNVQVTGPAQFQDSDAVTNAAGELKLNLRVDSDAEGDVSIRVQGLNGQFGAAADRQYSNSNTVDGKGLPVSANVATATTTVKGAEVVDPAGIGLRLDGHGNGAADDKVTANAKNNAAGLTAVLYRAGKKIASHKLNSTGNYQFLVGDENGKKATKYVVKVAATDTTQAGKAKTSVK